MNPTAPALLALVLALPAAAQEAKPTEGVIDTTFTWTSHERGSLELGGGASRWISEAELVLTATTPGPLDRLGGRCLISGIDTSGGGSRAVGTCVFADAEGDRIFEEIAHESAGGDAPVVGHATITGGTGKFAGLSGELDYDNVYFASPADGVYQGIGHKKGTWRMSGS